MKELLIYGALVAAIMGAAVPLITNLAGTATTQGTAINNALSTKIQSLVKSIG